MSSEAIPKDPQGWTSSINASDKVAAMLSECTDLPNIQVKLQETSGSRYLFQSGPSHYFWNSATEDAALVTSPESYSALLIQMERDMRKVEVVALKLDDD